MAGIESLDRHLASLQASQTTLDVLKDLHIQALTEPPYVSTDSQPASAALDRFVALEPDKCALVYLLLRASGARFVVEAGTSFGVSTIWLALAVGQNATAQNAPGKVIATENEPTKAERAREHWKKAGEDVEKWIELREGDLRETLKTDLPQVDFLLLDSEFSPVIDWSEGPRDERELAADEITNSLVRPRHAYSGGRQASSEAWSTDSGGQHHFRQCRIQGLAGALG